MELKSMPSEKFLNELEGENQPLAFPGVLASVEEPVKAGLVQLG